MKRLLLTTSIAALLLSSAAAFAKPPGHDKHDRDDRSGYYDRDHDRDRDHHDNGRHYGQVKKAYRHGDYVPVVYMEPRYYVEDYRASRRRRAAIAGYVRTMTGTCWSTSRPA